MPKTAKTTKNRQKEKGRLSQDLLEPQKSIFYRVTQAGFAILTLVGTVTVRYFIFTMGAALFLAIS